MLVIPAIDLKDGKCVRLRQGRMDAETVYADDPAMAAKRWEAEGAERLHVVDLNGAMEGTPIHREQIRSIAAAVRIPLQVGGGIRDLHTVEHYLSLGIQWVVLGTAAISNLPFVMEACARFPHRVIVSIDVKDRRVVTEGWIKQTEVGALALLDTLKQYALGGILYTDIRRDGMKTGPNIAGIRQMADASPIPILASGGVSGIHDIRRLHREVPTVAGVIVGRALYDGNVDLREALDVTRVD